MAWPPGLEEAELLGAVAHQQVLGLLIVIEHHAMGFAANARLLVSAKRRMRGIGMIAVDPDATGLNCTAKMVAAVGIAAPQSGTEPVERIVGDFQGVRFVLECGHRDYGSEDFFLEDAHAVVALEDGWLHIVAAIKITAAVRP